MRISDWSSDVCSSDLEYHFVDVAGSRDAPERSRRFAALLSGIGADVLHVHGLAFAGDAFAVSRRLPRMPPILCQDHADRPPRWWRRRPWKRWYAAVSGVSFTVAEQAQRFIDAGVLAKDMQVFAIPESSSRFTPGSSEEHTSELQSLMSISYTVF